MFDPNEVIVHARQPRNRRERRILAKKMDQVARGILPRGAIMKPITDNQQEKEPETMPEKTQRGGSRMREHASCEPVYIRKLRDSGMTTEEIGDVIGISGSHVSQLLSGNEKCRIAYDRAAELAYTKTHGKSKTTIHLLSLPSEHLNTVKSVVNSLGGKITSLDC